MSARYTLDGIKTAFEVDNYYVRCPCGYAPPGDLWGPEAVRATDIHLRFHYQYCALARGEDVGREVAP